MTDPNEYHKVPLTRKEKHLADIIDVIARYICAEILMDLAKEQMEPKKRGKI